MPSTLFSPIEIAGVALANRVVISPMCQYSALDGCATDWHLAHLGMLCGSGAALVFVEATHVERHGRITHGCMGLYSDECEAALARIVAFCRRSGTAKLGIQLAIPGARDRRSGLGRAAVRYRRSGPVGNDCAVGPALRSWLAAAPRHDGSRHRAGARGIRVGGGPCRAPGLRCHRTPHGSRLLGHSFISPLSNRRTDRYGGSAENRMRFASEIVQAVRAVVPRGVALGARVTGSDWLDGGLDDADAVFCAKALKEAGLDFIDVSSGGLDAQARNPAAPGYNVPIAAKIREATGLATCAVGLIVTADQAEAIVATGGADMVALARGVLDDPHWGWHAARKLGHDIKRPKQYLRAGPDLWAGVAMREKTNVG